MTNEIYAARRENLRKLMHKEGLDALFVSHAANRFYLSGFELHDCQPNESSGRLIITADGRDWLCTDARYLDAARRLWDGDRIFIYGGNAASQLSGFIKKNIHGRIGLEASSVSVRFYEDISDEDLRFEAADGLVESLRRIKGPEEIAALEQSFELNHSMFRWVRSRCISGVSEAALSWEIEQYFRNNGASELAFPSIVAVGPNGALPHAIPGHDSVSANCPMLIDAGCRVADYCSDQTRSFWIGGAPTPEFSRTLRLVQTAQLAAIKLIRPGVLMSDVYRAALAVFDQAGVAQHFTHGLGHGVGLETHEAPSLNPRSPEPLQAGMVVTVEPGLYYPEWGGIRWEHTVVIEDGGARIL